MKEKPINDNLSSKNPALQRLIAFLGGRGRLSAIAKKIGRSENVFSNMINRDTEPSIGLLRDLSEEFPEMDLHYISTGNATMKQAELEKKVKDMEAEMSYQRAIVNKLVMPGKTKGAINSPDRMREIRAIQGRQAIANARSRKRTSFPSVRVQNASYRTNL